MSGPFSSSSPTGQPTWTTQTAQDGNFAMVQVGGGTATEEVGYGEGGYGEDGYDTPAVTLPRAATPDWQVYSLK